MDSADKPRVDAAPQGGNAVTAHISEEDEAHAGEYERRVQEQMKAQLQRLRDEARALFGMVNGRPGVTSPREWAKLLEQRSLAVLPPPNPGAHRDLGANVPTSARSLVPA